MRIYVLISVFTLIIGCSTGQGPTSKDNIFACKQACRGQVQKYTDDLIECECKVLKVAR